MVSYSDWDILRLPSPLKDIFYCEVLGDIGVLACFDMGIDGQVLGLCSSVDWDLWKDKYENVKNSLFFHNSNLRGELSTRNISSETSETMFERLADHVGELSYIVINKFAYPGSGKENDIRIVTSWVGSILAGLEQGKSSFVIKSEGGES